MKKRNSIIIGIASPGYLFLIYHLMYLCEYNEMYADIRNAMLFILPALPGITLAFLLISDSLEAFVRSWSVCFMSSVIMCAVWNILRIDLIIYTALTGSDQIAMGDSLLMAVMLISYMISCTVGCITAAVISGIRGRMNIGKPTDKQ